MKNYRCVAFHRSGKVLVSGTFSARHAKSLAVSIMEHMASKPFRLRGLCILISDDSTPLHIREFSVVFVRTSRRGWCVEEKL